MKEPLLLVLFFLCVHTRMAGQTPIIDSLRKELTLAKADSIKVHDRIRISWYIIQLKDSAQAWKLIHEADSIADKTGNPILKGIVYEHMGYLYNRMFSKKAVTYYLQAENILKHYPNSLAAKKSMASLAMNLGIEHMNVSDEETALHYYFESIKRYEELDSTHGNLSLVYSNIINSYYNLGKFQSALSYCEKAYYFSMKRGHPAAQMSATINYGRVLWKLGQKERAQVLFDECKQIADRVSDYYFQSNYYQIIGNFEYDENKFENALNYFSKGLALMKGYNSPYDMAVSYLWMGTCHVALGKFSEARRYFDSAYHLTRFDYPHQLKYVYHNLYLMERKKGNWEQAIHYLDSFNVLKDSIQHVEDANRIEFLDAKYQAGKKEAQINQLQSDTEIQGLKIQRKNAMNYILFGAVLIIILIGTLLLRNFRQKQKLQQQKIIKLETEKQLMATESVLKGEEQERARLAQDLHDGLGGMLSGIKYSFNTMKRNLVMTPDNMLVFERSMDMLDSSIKEMRRVAHNMMPEALVKFGLDTALKDFCNDIQQSGALMISYQSIGMENTVVDQSTSITIYRIVQELVNNTLKHASAKTAIVQVTKSNGVLAVTVEDDGNGFDTAILKQAKGIGWVNILNRVELLKGTMDVQSGKEKGTSVHIEFNVT